MSRQTIPVTDLLATANTALKQLDLHGATDEDRALTRARREGIIFLVESALHATGQYKGFSYLPTEFTDESRTGVYRLRDGYDDTRRRYHE